jgi:hypothetical protein
VGSATSAPATDYIGTARPQGAGYDIGAYEFVAPVVTISAASLVTSSSARLNGNVTVAGGNNPTVTIYWGTSDGGNVAGSWANNTPPTSPIQPQGVSAFYYNLTGLTAGTTYYYNAYAVNGAGGVWAGTSQSFTTTIAPVTTTTTSSTPVSTSIALNLPTIFGIILVIAMLITAVTTRSITAVIVATIICILGVLGIVLLQGLVMSIFGGSK